MVRTNGSSGGARVTDRKINRFDAEGKPPRSTSRGDTTARLVTKPPAGTRPIKNSGNRRRARNGRRDRAHRRYRRRGWGRAWRRGSEWKRSRAVNRNCHSPLRREFRRGGTVGGLRRSGRGGRDREDCGAETRSAAGLLVAWAEWPGRGLGRRAANIGLGRVPLGGAAFSSRRCS